MGAWDQVLPKADFAVDLGELGGWEHGKPQSQLPEGGRLVRQDGKLALQLPVKGQILTASFDSNGRARLTGDLMARIVDGTMLVVESHGASDSGIVGQWKLDLGPRFALFGIVLKDPDQVDQQRQARPVEMGLVSKAFVVSRLESPVEIYLGTGGLLRLEPHGRAAVSQTDLDSPHLRELVLRKCVDIERDD
jgi:hypothetical protein